MSGDLTNSGGNFVLEVDAAVLDHTGTTSLTIQSGGAIVLTPTSTTTIGTVVVNAAAISAVSTIGMSGDLTNSGG
eukprot:CAMPEP_0171482478 /NCGR_PEP_ID=MMETSP0946-20130122/7496_1 /TAXON_ID=109269 /ORGANISM="Vaucheria litorea, Strain CCMP2940" /LENGTH=74 /DNA_ID=CAMNT_0012014511 /DNA_START=1 /DNA_END=221 /DNA_ORIENTATION=-